MSKGCKRCGRCCQYSEVLLDPGIDEKVTNFYMRRMGAFVVYRDNGKLRAMLARCPNLSKDGKTCMIYEYRPDMCKDHPLDPSQIFPGCRYYDEED